MRRLAVVAGMLAAAPAAAQQAQPAPQISAEEALANYQAAMAPAVTRCPQPRNGQEVVVCARVDNDRYRAPRYAARDYGRASVAGGEQRAAMAAGDSRCTAVGRAQQCGGGLPVFAIVSTIARAVIEVVRGDD